MERIRVRIGYEGCFEVPSEGSSSGLALIWKKVVKLTVKNFSFYHIDAHIADLENDIEWKLIGLYGHPVTKKCGERCELLRHFKAIETMPWLVCGDFNEVLSNQEKHGGRPRIERLMNAFRCALEECHLSDLGYVGPK